MNDLILSARPPTFPPLVHLRAHYSGTIEAGGYEMGCVQNFGGARGSVLVEALRNKPEVGDLMRCAIFFFFFNLPNPSGRTRPLG
jgi:hypothetical protein